MDNNRFGIAYAIKSVIGLSIEIPEGVVSTILTDFWVRIERIRGRETYRSSPLCRKHRNFYVIFSSIWPILALLGKNEKYSAFTEPFAALAVYRSSTRTVKVPGNFDVNIARNLLLLIWSLVFCI